MKRKILLVFIFILGLGIFSFPLFSNWYNNRVQYTLKDDYQRELDQLQIEELEQIIENAHRFNQALVEGNATYMHPYSDEMIVRADSIDYPEGFEFGKVIGSVEIPKIDVNLPILVGISDDILARGVGYFPNTSLPVGGENVHTVLTAHRGLPTSELFRNLDLLEVGDVFFVNSLGETLAYEVDQIKIIEPTQLEDLRIEFGKDYTTLLTCHPYMVNTERLLVRGHRIDYVEPAEIDKWGLFWARYKEYLIAGGVIAIIITVSEVKKRKKR